MKKSKILVFILISSFSVKGYTYTEATHEDLSSNALELSNISLDETILKSFGLNPLSKEQLFTNPNNPIGDKFSIDELVRDGAKFEDNLIPPRSFHHFYNPINETPLTVGIEVGFPSPDWALEDRGDIDPLLDDPQEYSYKDAMNYFYLALTSETEEERDLKWGELFLTLGHVVHHVQDMAQPDHVRNDEHNDFTDPSWYEEYTNTERENSASDFNALMTGGSYPIPAFATAREFWTTRATDSIVADRRGMADFTNRNFVSKDTMFTIVDGVIQENPQLPLPEPHATPVAVDIVDIMGAQGQTLCDEIKARSLFEFNESHCFIDFIGTDVVDSYTNQTTENQRAASYSIFDKKLQDYNVEAELVREDGSIDIVDRLFTLNSFNFDAAHEYLVPRAVAYSAGLINHFFRGKIAMTFSEEGDGLYIRNSTYGGSYMEGTFTLFYDDVLGSRKKVPGATWSTSDYVANGRLYDSMLVPSYDVPSDIGIERNYMLVFEGKLNGENIISAKQIQGGNYQLMMIVNQSGYNERPLPGTINTYFSTGVVYRLWDMDNRRWHDFKTTEIKSNVDISSKGNVTDLYYRSFYIPELEFDIENSVLRMRIHFVSNSKVNVNVVGGYFRGKYNTVDGLIARLRSLGVVVEEDMEYYEYSLSHVGRINSLIVEDVFPQQSFFIGLGHSTPQCSKEISSTGKVHNKFHTGSTNYCMPDSVITINYIGSYDWTYGYLKEIPIGASLLYEDANDFESYTPKLCDENTCFSKAGRDPLYRAEKIDLQGISNLYLNSN